MYHDCHASESVFIDLNQPESESESEPIWTAEAMHAFAFMSL
jgi:hypothetical protein